MGRRAIAADEASSQTMRRLTVSSTLGLVLVALVALGSRASTFRPGPHRASPLRVPGSVLEYLGLLVAPLVLAGAALVVMVFGFRRPRKRTPDQFVREPLPVRWWAKALVMTLAVAVIAVPVALAVWGSHRAGHVVTPGLSGQAPASVAPSVGPGASTGASRMGWSWVPVAVVAGIAAVFVAAFAARRPRRGKSAFGEHAPLARGMRRAVADSIAELRAEPDPRRAVIAAYARMEHDLASYGLPRRSHEAPLEYLGRLLGQLDVSAMSAATLTELFERAKFSAQPIGADVKQDAIRSLEAINGELAKADI